MKNFLLFVILFISSCITQKSLKTPREQYGKLFETIQTQRVFPDNKTFVDAVSKLKPEEILRAYKKQSTDKDFNLKAFANEYFELPSANHKKFVTQNENIRKHIDTLWTVLQRKADVSQMGSLIPLPHPYIVPGGRFREVYYWDSYFTMLGLKQSRKIETIQDMIDNFAYLIDRFGFVPNGNRTYYLTRSQPPFFSLMIDLLAQAKGDEIYIKYQPQLIKEYQFWMHGKNELDQMEAAHNLVKLGKDTFLNRYWDESDQPREESYDEDIAAAKLSSMPNEEFYRNVRAAAESGWDFSSRWFADGENLKTIETTNIVPVDLNCLLYFMEQTIARSFSLQNDVKNANIYRAYADERKNAIIRYCWNDKNGWFLDYDYKLKEQTGSLSLAGVFPLFFKIADLYQANKVAFMIQQKFLKPGGLVTTLKNTNQQWDSPNGWAPLQYIAIKGLRNYKLNVLGDTIAKRWIYLNKRVFKQTGKLMEKYNVVDLKLGAGGGEYPLQDGFGWTNGVLLELMNNN
ncbi:alpha,alpha-trehalase TreA [Pedobacter sp. SD-b]|uniref:Alpha,alpha-trehalase TreA n=1 Tax=Pedobacter segetis TaxID=2793069 RepID=A0ABS1BIX1_9SPHI|nr:alpha,alpha-trehalase TreA [Pedobacter segetis]MBK0382149.1 alpha,alpha-trehalase TreA [Pedobacter segetis]